jgi:hypothetical protein
MKEKIPEQTNHVPLVRKYPKYSRNELCPCGSGKKFKHCCELAYRLNLSQKVINFRQDHMKNEIINYLKTDRSFASGAKLYHKLGHNLALIKKFNLQGESKSNLDMLHYQLWKLTGLPEKEFNEIMMKPVEKSQISNDKTQKVTEPSEVPNTEQQTTNPEQIISVAEAIKFKLREEFPFLSDKSCPDAFKILVADMMTAHENYVKAHEELFNITNEQDAFDAADKLINNYLDNQEIWKELNYYKNTGTVLGKHSYFEDQNRQKELTSKSVPDLMIMLRNIEHSIWRVTKKMKDDPKPELVARREKSIRDYERDKKIIKSLLNIND